MWRNYLVTAVRNLERNRFYAGVTIAGLAIGFAAALLIGLYVRDELTYDRFTPGAERVFLASQTIVMGASQPLETQYTQMMLAEPLKAEFQEIEAVARLSPSYFPPTVRRGEIVGAEQNLFWGDPNFLEVVRLPLVAGERSSALAAPDSIVLTRATARKYFGRDAPLGETLRVEGQPMRVTAVLEDLPSQTHMTAQIIASARAPQSPISQYEAINGPNTNTLATYVRLRPGASIETMQARLRTFLDRRLPLGPAESLQPIQRTLHLIPLPKVHLTRASQGTLKPPADPGVIAGIALMGGLIVVVAAINFVTLMTARAARRAVEVGVRKAAGARRIDLIAQFMGEAMVYVLVAGVCAVALAELLMGPFNAFLQRSIAFDYLSDPALAASMAGVVAATGLLAGAYPALVLSKYRPAAVLKGGPVEGGGGRLVRTGLVVAQFSVLIALIVAAVTIGRQTLYALNEGMRVEQDQVLLVFSRPCSERLRDLMRAQAGVRSAACVSAMALDMADSRDEISLGDRRSDVSVAAVDFDFFEVFGIEPLAGRFFDRSRPADGEAGGADSYAPVVLNETAARRLGFSSPQAAVGASVRWHGVWDESQRKAVYTIPPLKPSRVIGVAPDFTLGSLRDPVKPTLFAIGRNLPPYSIGLAAKLDGARIPETLAAVDAAWRQVGGGRPLLRVFADQFTLRLYIDTLIQGATVALAALVALSIACLGLFALSAFTTEQRTKEIGVRKAMGASAGDILGLLIWRFSRPVLAANIIAWPAAWLAMRWWLDGFAYHVELAAWTFAAAGAGALAIAWATVFTHALRVARAKPVNALRYE